MQTTRRNLAHRISFSEDPCVLQLTKLMELAHISGTATLLAETFYPIAFCAQKNGHTKEYAIRLWQR